MIAEAVHDPTAAWLQVAIQLGALGLLTVVLVKLLPSLAQKVDDRLAVIIPIVLGVE